MGFNSGFKGLNVPTIYIYIYTHIYIYIYISKPAVDPVSISKKLKCITSDFRPSRG